MNVAKFRVWTGKQMIYPDAPPPINIVSYPATSIDFILAPTGQLLLMTENGTYPIARFCGRYGVAGAGISFTNPIALFSTQMLDSMGREIYEGDILKETFRYCDVYSYCPELWKPYVRHCLVEYKAPSFTIPEVDDSFQSVVEGRKLKVVGNAFENPNLLKRCEDLP